MVSVETSLLLGVCASFLTGVMGYIIARHWIRPIVRYNIIKQRLNNELTRCLSAGESADNTGTDPTSQAQLLKSARKHNMELVSRHSELPYWYQYLLTSRMESPFEALGLLTSLSNIKDCQQKEDRIQDVRKKLNLK